MATGSNNDKFNEDELEAPEWLNAKFFTEVLFHHERCEELKVIEVNISPASAKGDHYASVMFRGKVTYTTERGEFTKSLIVKTMPEIEGHKMDLLEKSYVFETEIGMYTKILPRYEEILRSVGDNTKLHVPCLYHSLEPRKVMVFEDLVEQGYTVIRNREATNEELKCAFSKLAKWHAIGFKILKESPEYLSDFKYGLFETPKIMDDPAFISGMKHFIHMLESIPELMKYTPLFKKMENGILDDLKKVMQEYRENWQPNGYYVLSHGDFHIRNMMFKSNKDNGSFEDCMLLDFQFSNSCPFTIDVINSIYMLLGPEDRKYNYSDFLVFYFNTFVETLKKVGFTGELPTEAEFWNQLAKHKAYEIFLVTSFLPVMIAIKAGQFDPVEVFQNLDASQKLYFVESFIEEVKYLIPRFQERGYFD